MSKDKTKESGFDVNREDLYEYDKPKGRTRKRLLEMAELGMTETGIASFGIKDVMSGLYIERVWRYSDKDFKGYMDWVREMIQKSDSKKLKHMATVNYHLKGKKNPSPIYIRVAEGKSLDLWEKTGIYVNPEFWEHKKQQVRKVLDVSNRDEINANLKKLEVHVIDEFNKAYMTGQIINKIWLSESIKLFFNRPKEEDKLINQNRSIYFTDYAQHWLDEKAPKHKVSSSKYMDAVTIGHYQQLVDNVKKYEGRNKMLLKEITSDLLDSFSTYLTSTEGYASATAKRKLARFKFFCERAESENLEVNRQYKERVFLQKDETEYKQPYLNENEINRIFKYKLEKDCLMDNVRDNFIIGLWTGLRVSDFLTRLDVSNIDNGFIRIKTLKTKSIVNIPIHPQVDSILNKRNGKLPAKISEQKFNKHIKMLSRLCDIDEEMIGGVSKVDEKTKIKRKEVGLYKKHELITSHICRRSFCTNLFGKIPNSSIMAVAGWKSESQMLEYVKLTNIEKSIELKNYWSEKYK